MGDDDDNIYGDRRESERVDEWNGGRIQEVEYVDMDDMDSVVYDDDEAGNEEI
jgi:hypothetical protein